MDTATNPAPPDSSGTIPGPDDPRTHLASAVAVATTVMEGVRPDQLDRATPCGDMDVRDLLEHVVMAMRRVALAGRGVPFHEWPTEAADARGGGWVEGLQSAAHEVQAAWTDDALLERPTTLPWGTFPGSAVLGVYTNEVIVHTWDLATATDQSPVWDQGALESAWAAISAQLPMADRTPMWEIAKTEVPEGIPFVEPFANAVGVADDAPLIDRLVAWNGRDPRGR